MFQMMFFTRTMAQKDAFNHYYLTRTDYLKSLNLNIGLGIQYSAAKANSNSSSVAPTNASVNSLDLSSFSGSVSVNYASTTLSDNQHILIENSLEVGLWQLVLGPDLAIRDTVAAAVQSAMSLGTTEAYAEFIDKYGTHYIDSVIVGGKLAATTVTDYSSTNSTEQLALLANFGFKQLFGLDSGNLSLDVNFTEKHNQFSQDSTNDLSVLGGDPQLNDFFAGNFNPADTFVQWSQSLIANPAVIRYRCREMSWLFASPVGDTTRRQTVKDVIRQYMAGSLDV